MAVIQTIRTDKRMRPLVAGAALAVTVLVLASSVAIVRWLPAFDAAGASTQPAAPAPARAPTVLASTAASASVR